MEDGEGEEAGGEEEGGAGGQGGQAGSSGVVEGRWEASSAAALAALAAAFPEASAAGGGGGGGGGGGSAAAAATAPPPPPTPAAQLLPLDDVACEGNGALPTALLASYAPHGPSNILCCAVLPAPLAAAGDLWVASGSARGEVVIACLGLQPCAAAAVAALPLPPPLRLPAPVLCLAVRPPPSTMSTPATTTTTTITLAASCMDGSVHLLEHAQGSGSGSATPTPATLLHSFPSLHSKYATRVAWSGDGRVLASAGADGTLALFLCGAAAGAAAAVASSSSSSAAAAPLPPPHKLQQLNFSAGAVEAMAWSCEQEGAAEEGSGEGGSGGGRVDTLLISVRASPNLFYLRLVWGSAAAGAVEQASGTQWALAPQPTLEQQQQQRVAERLPVLPLPHAPPLTLLLYRAPLTEDCAAGDISWRAMRSGQGSPGAAASFPSAGSSQGGAASSGAPSHPQQHSSTILDIAIGPTPSAAAAAPPRGQPLLPPLVATITEGGTVYVFRLGRFGGGGGGGGGSGGGLYRRMLGRLVGAAGAASAPRLAWQPRGSGGQGSDAFYLAATSQEGDAVEVLSVGAGRRVARLAGGGTLKGLAWCADGSALVTCGFDKRVSVWGQGT
jgi:hypothetical protein